MKVTELESYKLKDVKGYLKELAQTIKIMKALRKTVYKADLSKYNQDLVKDAESIIKKNYCGDANWAVDRARNEFRHLHIAYCEARGKTREQIEGRYDKKLDNEAIAFMKGRIVAEMKAEQEAWENEKALRVSA